MSFFRRAGELSYLKQLLVDLPVLQDRNTQMVAGTKTQRRLSESDDAAFDIPQPGVSGWNFDIAAMKRAVES